MALMMADTKESNWAAHLAKKKKKFGKIRIKG